MTNQSDKQSHSPPEKPLYGDDFSFVSLKELAETELLGFARSG
jgi:hypothetical protein